MLVTVMMTLTMADSLSLLQSHVPNLDSGQRGFQDPEEDDSGYGSSRVLAVCNFLQVYPIFS